jgi:hypothetical protein
MTRLLTTGYETGDVNEAGTSTIGATSTMTAVNTAPAPRAGAYCLKCACTSSTFAATYKTFNLGAAKTDVWIRFAVYFHPIGTTEWVFAATQDSAGGAQNCLTWDPSSGAIRARLSNTNAGTLLGTAGTALPADTWHVIDWRVQITSTTVGVVEVWLDGNRVINFSGDNTSSTTANVQFVLLGHVSPSVSSATGMYIAIDDIGVNDAAGTLNNARLQDGRVVLLVPSGAGSSTQFTRGGTDTGANFSQVNELPPSMAQYVGSNTVGNRDLYALGDIPVAVQSINVVEAVLLAQNSDAGGGSIAPTIKSSAAINEATAIGLTTSPGYVVGRWETDPNTSAAWTVAAVNAAEAGATVR